VAETGAPYEFVGGNPLNGTDPLGLVFATGWQDDDFLEPVYKTTTRTFNTGFLAEEHVASIFTNARIHFYIQTKTQGVRFVDVYVPPPTHMAIEVKTGRQALSGRIQAQINKDQDIEQNSDISVSWRFYPNGKGVNKPSGPLLEALGTAHIPTTIYEYVPMQTTCDTLTAFSSEGASCGGTNWLPIKKGEVFF
jgi:hypothetical protein